MITAVAWHPDGRRLAVGLQNSDIVLWNPDWGRLMPLRGHSRAVRRLHFHPMGDLLASASDDGSTHLWNASSGNLLFVAHAGHAWGWSGDGSRLAFEAGDHVGIWELAYGSIYREYVVPMQVSFQIHHIAPSPCGQWIVAATGDGLMLWHLPSQKFFMRPVGSLQWMAFTVDGTALLTGGEGGVLLWDFDCQRIIRLGSRRRRELYPHQPECSTTLLRRECLTQS